VRGFSKLLQMDHTIAYQRGKNEVTNRAYGPTLTSGQMARDRPKFNVSDARLMAAFTRPSMISKNGIARLTGHTLLTEKEMSPALARRRSPMAPPLQKAGRLLGSPLWVWLVSRSAPRPIVATLITEKQLASAMRSEVS